VTPPGGAEKLLAGDYAFRTEQASASRLDNWAMISEAGSHQVCDFALAEALPPPDTTPPAVSITAPAPGASVTGTVAVTAGATDNVGVAGVQFLVDGAPLGAEDPSAPYSASWNASGAAAGSHALTAVARDAAGNRTTSAPVSVTNAACKTSSPSWLNTPMAGQSSAFEATFDTHVLPEGFVELAGRAIDAELARDILGRRLATSQRAHDAAHGQLVQYQFLEQRLVEGVQDHGCCHLPSESALVSPASACKPLSESCLPDPAD